MIVLDTSVLSLAFRRRAAGARVDPRVGALAALIEVGDLLAVPGIVVQEVLSGVRAPAQFDRLAGLLAPLPVLLADRSHHVRAAQVANACRRRGVTVSVVDALIAAQTIEHRGRLFTADRDFEHIAQHSELRLFRIRED
ncbi:MAG: PIN domain-containing protein [Myxococcales bacterium]|nr:PIN domain-containing protein [Myxococcales bacterium]